MTNNSSSGEVESQVAESMMRLFDNSEAIRIPDYQRAYSWEEKQCSQFIEDLMEIKGKKYYMGQLLFEKEGDTLYIIDGQQRITTTVLFQSAVVKVLQDKGEECSGLQDRYLTDVFKTINNDHSCFRKVTRKHLIPAVRNADTLSQKRIIEAFEHFYDRLKTLNVKEIRLLSETLENAVISTFYISSKIEATQVFEYQNNRGKGLSRFEVIKAYLMHQIYLQADSNVEANQLIKEIQSNIEVVYRCLESVEGYFTENELLNYYTTLFHGTDGNIQSIKEQFKEEDDAINWILRFFENFVDFTEAARNVVNDKSELGIANLFLVGNDVNWRLVLLTIYYKGDNEGETYEKILKLLEVLTFKMKLGDYRTDSLPSYAKEYFGKHNGGIEELHKKIHSAAQTGFQWYWNNDDRFSRIVEIHFCDGKYHYRPQSTVKYLLWQYENEQRRINRSGALLDRRLFKDYTIEHIIPQNPENGEEHEEKFKEEFLHLAGNLALLTQSQNSRFRNKSFEKKKELFQDTALSSYTEIRGSDNWGKREIKARHGNLCDFAKKYFAVDPLYIITSS